MSLSCSPSLRTIQQRDDAKRSIVVAAFQRMGRGIAIAKVLIQCCCWSGRFVELLVSETNDRVGIHVNVADHYRWPTNHVCSGVREIAEYPGIASLVVQQAAGSISAEVVPDYC